jgi:hypothetical protein
VDGRDAFSGIKKNGRTFGFQQDTQTPFSQKFSTSGGIFT